ncbi:TolC family protein [Leptospira neocaledonica]|nr:TolC family protein [Leptospira neocaledonica]
MKKIFCIIACLFALFFSTSFFAKSVNDGVEMDLEKAVLLGLANNVILKNLERQNEVFQMTVREKWREYLPKLGVSYFGLRNLNQNQQDSVYNDIRLTIQQLVYDGGENGRLIESARLSAEINKAEIQVQIRKTKIDVVRQYMKIISNRGKYLSSRRLYRSFEGQLNDTTLEYKNGLKSRLDFLEVSAKFNEAKLSLLRAETEFKNSITELKLILQLEDSDDFVIQENIFYDYYIEDPKPILDSDEGNLEENRPDLKKSKIIVNRLKLERETLESGWKPKLFAGGYYGKNTNDVLPVIHDNYGFNFSVVVPLGSSTLQSQSNYGIQTDGTGIQRIPGYGPQFVGQGANSFNSANLQLFDNLSQARKVLEGELKFVDAKSSYEFARKQAKFETIKARDKVLENYSVISVLSQKVLLYLENFRINRVKFKSGQLKRTDLLKSEYEFSKTQDDLADAYSEYLRSCYEYFYVTGRDLGDLPFYKVNLGKGNSIVAKLVKETRENEDFFPEKGRKK